MKAIRKEVSLALPAAVVWDYLRIPSGLPTLYRGVVLLATGDETSRTLCLAGGELFRESIRSINDFNLTISYSIEDDRLTFHETEIELEPVGPSDCLLRMQTRFRPDACAVWLAPLIDQLCAAAVAAAASQSERGPNDR